MTVRLFKRKKYWLIGGILLITALVVPVISFATSPTINEWPTAIAKSTPVGIVTGPDGNLWFDQGGSNQIGKIIPSSGVITEYNLPAGPPFTYSQNPDGIATGPDGNLWVGIISPVSGPPLIGKMTTSGNLTEYPLNSGYLLPNSLVTGPDGNMWFAGSDSNNIGVMNTSGTLLHTYPAAGLPEGLSVGPDGNIWFVEQTANQVAKMNPSNGVVTTYSVPATPTDTAVGPDGNIWIAGSYGNYVSKINPSTGAITTYPIPVPSVFPYYGPIFLAKGPDGNMWVTLEGYGLASINPTTGVVNEYETQNLGSGPTAEGVTAGPDGNVWFTAADNNSAIGDIVLNTASNNVAASITSPNSVSVASGSQLSFTVTTTGTPVPSISESGSLPQGITFKDDGNGKGTLSGLTSLHKSTNFDLTFKATNTVGINSQSFVLKVTSPGSSSGPSGNTGNDCPNSTSAAHSASGCSANAPGQAGKTDNPVNPVLVTPNTKSIVVSNIGKDQTEAIVAVGLDLSSSNYTVPNNQVLYDDGTLGTVVAGAGATVKGSGKIIGNLTLKKGAVLAPGHSPGCITTGGLTLLGTYKAQISGTAACSDYDQVTVNGKASLDGNLLLSLPNGYVPSSGQQFTILHVALGSTLSGHFIGLPEGSIFSSQGVTYQITYKTMGAVLSVKSVDSDISSAAAAAINTKLADNLVSLIVSKAIIEFAALAIVSAVLFMFVAYFEARP